MLTATKSTRIKLNSENKTKEFADTLSTKIKVGDVVFLYGEIGVGKTTFIKYLCQELGVDPSSVNSPTYAIVNEYETLGDQLIFHFDFYRIKDENEAYDMGYENYFYSNHYCFIEWPEKSFGIIPVNCIQISILKKNSERIFNFAL